MVFVFSGGGTLGHVIPAIPVIKKLKEKYPDSKIIYIATKNGLENNKLKSISEIDELLFIDVQGLRRNVSFYNVITLYKYLKSYNYLRKYFKKEKPFLVIGMGGYVSLVTIKAAISLKIKTIVHEQNSVIGLSNKLVLEKTNRVLLSMEIPEIMNKKNVCLIGNPRISEIYDEYSKINIIRKRNVLVVGGSRGAEKINEVVMGLSKRFEKENLDVTLITGKLYFKNNLQKIKEVENKNLKIIAFTEDLIPYLLRAEVVVSRSGATTISEIIALNKPAIFIPSPNVTKNHQEINAKMMIEKDAGIMIIEHDLTKELLIDSILKIINDKEYRNKITKNIACNFSHNSLELFINEIEDVLNE